MLNNNFKSRGWEKIVWAAGILLAVTVSFYPSLDNGFVNWDDESHLLRNPAVLTLTPGNVLQHFRETVHKTYIPLTTLSFAVENHFFGLKPFVYHLDNLLLHLGVVVLAYWFALQVGLPLMAAAVGALLFGIHPMHVESVAWVTERKDVLYAFFYMLSLNFYWAYLKEPRKRGSYFLSLVFGLLSILSKAMALSLPLVLFCCDYLSGRKWDKKTFLDKIPFFLYIVPVAWVTYSLYARVPALSLMKGLLIWIWTFTFYIFTFFTPFNVTPLYEVPRPAVLANGEYLASLIFFVICIVVFIRLRKDRFFTFAWIFYFCSIFFLLRFDARDISIVADRFMYLPSLGICLLLGKLSRQIIQYKKIYAAVLSALLIVLGAATYQQCDVWRDSITLWSNVLKKYPHSYYALTNRADVFSQQGQYERALADSSLAIALNPQGFLAYSNRGCVYAKMGLYDLALADFNKTVELNPMLDAGYLNRGHLYEILGEYDLAIKDYSAALAMSPRDFQSLNNRGTVYGMMGEYDKALADFNAALEINPNFVSGLISRGAHYGKGGEYDLAVGDLTRAIALDPDNPAAYYNRYQAYLNWGNKEMAARDEKKFTELNSAAK